MGIALTWVAVEALPPGTALSRLSLSRTGRSCAFPFQGVAGLRLPSGWYLVAASGCAHRVAHSASLAALSASCRVVACTVEEHVNLATAELWQDGVRAWKVQHQGDEDSQRITHEGAVPRRFHDLLATVEPEGSSNPGGHVHMDIPLLLAQDLTGFRHDDAGPHLGGPVFEQLSDLQPRAPWWKFWA